MKSALDVHRELLAREVRHELVHLRGRLSSADDLPRMLELTDGCAAVRCYVPSEGGPRLVALLVPCGAVLDEQVLAAALSVDGLRPAAPGEVSAATDFAAALVCPVGLPADVRLVVDAAVAARHVLYTAAGEGGVALGIRARDLVDATGAEVVALAPSRRLDLDAGDTVISLAEPYPAREPRA